MKITTNVFQEGIQTDLHPLSTSQQVLTDALNATMLTYNGNEMMLQNDMGNTLIQDSATGNIMGLNPGFIPTGIKEHGGIMYITSVGKDANGNPIGEIGTIPSPIIRDIYKDKITYTVNNFIPIGLGDPLTITHKLYPADKFIVNLNMQVDESSLIGTKHYKASALSDGGGNPDGDPSDIVLSRKVIGFAGRTYSLHTPLISYVDPEDKKVQLLQQTGSTNEVNLFSTKGVYSLDMYSTNVNGSKKVSGPLTYPQQYNGGASKYWYLHNDGYESVFPKDLFEATLNKSLKQFPSSNKPGQLAVKLTPEKIGEFGMLPRKNDPKNTPITVKWTSPSTRYRSFFPGFYYSTDSGIYIDKLKNIRVVDENSGKDVSLSIYNGSIDRKSTISFQNITLNPYPSTVSKAGFFTTKQWENTGQYPQTVSQASYELTNNLYPKWEGNRVFFILSSICDIKDHTKTELLSSTEGQDTHPHGGLFLADLGTKYNNWYRLELDYYDQYNNLQGSFSTRFNPYINDTFGTNLDITGVEMVDGVAMGGDKITKVLHPEKDPIQNDYNFTGVYRFPTEGGWTIRPWIHYQNNIDTYQAAIFKHYHWDSPYNAQQYSYFTSPKYAQNSQTTDNTDKYLFQVYSPKLSNLKYILSSDESDVHISTALTPLKDGDDRGITEVGILNNTDNGDNEWFVPLMWQEQTHTGEPDKWVENDQTGCGTINRTGNYSIGFKDFYILDTDGKTLRALKISDAFYTGDQKLDATPQEAFWVTTKNTSNELARNRSFDIQSSPDIFPLTLNIVDGKLENGTAIGFNKPYDTKIPCVFGALSYSNPQTNDSFDSYTEAFAICPINQTDDPHFELKASKHFSEIKYTFDYTLTPAYKITPYFLLTGTADNTTSVYPRRFVSYKKENGQFKYIDNMSYEYNLEKVSVALGITSSKITIPNSSYLKELEGYAADIVGVKLTLDAGIYTLNMTGVPNKLKDTATITINNTKLNIHTQGELKTESGTVIANQFYFYQPVVFMLEQRSDVTVSVNCGASVDDEVAFQEIGLYKVNTVDVDSISAFIDMYTKAGGLTVCTYKEYMNNLIKTIKAQDSDGQNKELLPSERYALIQKYGIFFKEAYVFTEGLYNATNKTINEVKIADSTNGDSLTYTAVPYIPADPSILPITLQPDSKGELIYTWNIYVMPDSILETNYEDKDAAIPDFVFTNGVPTAVPTTTKPGSYNLRKSYGGFNFPIRDILNDPTNMIPQGPGILGPLSPK